MIKTKPSAKKVFSRHSVDFSEKEVFEATIEPFVGSNGKELVNLHLNSSTGNIKDNTYRGQGSIYTLTSNQLGSLKAAIDKYYEKKLEEQFVVI